MLRTLGGKNIGKCRLRAHQHPLSPPLPNLRRARSIQNLQGKTRRQRVIERVLGDVLLPTSILDFKPKLENRCKLFQVYALQRALILDLRGSIGESLMFYRRNAPGDAVILDFRLRLGNHCKIIPKNTLQRAVILDLRGLIWESLQGNSQEWLWRCSDS